MFLCDIGNSRARFSKEGKIWSINVDELRKFNTNEQVFYICVNEKVKKDLKSKKNFVDLEPFLEIDTIYVGMGVDRIAACMGVDDGIVVDAGSAITVDIMSKKTHLGGFILPGLEAFKQSYAQISSRLDIILNPSVSLDALPQCTTDAVSYGVIKSVIDIIKNTSCNKKIFCTGGDGQFLSKFLDKSIYDKTLVFRGMQRVYKKAIQC